MLDSAPRKDTRERILEVAESAVLAKGFAATSIEELIAAVGITKSGFFYHFKDKSELAKGLLLRYLDASCSTTFFDAAMSSTKIRCTASLLD
jgi:AcrR family transcriptional regulator